MSFKYLALSVIILSFISIGPSLQFSLGGDDWLALHRYIVSFKTLSDHFNLAKYVGNYDAANILMGIIYRLFGFQTLPYYRLAFVLRIMAALSFYLSVYALSKNKKLAYLVILLFSVTYIGIETTNWVFNMTSYISITLFNLFIYLYFRDKKNLKETLLESLVLFLAFFFTPNRMHGLVFIIPVLEVLKIRSNLSTNLKLTIFRISIFLLPMFIWRKLTASDWDNTYSIMAINFLQQPIKAIFYLFSNIGSAILPDRFIYLFYGDGLVSNTFQLISIVIPISVLGVLRAKRYLLLMIYSLILILTVNFIPETKSLLSQINFIKTLTGGFFIIGLLIFFYTNLKRVSQLPKLGLLGLFIGLAFLIAPWLIFSVGGPLSSDSRYLTIPSAYFYLATLTWLIMLWQHKTKFYNFFVISSILLLFLSNFYSLRDYFYFYLNHGRNTQEEAQIFNQISPNLNQYDHNSPIVFLFFADDPAFLYNAITFGFQYHMMLIDPNIGLNYQTSPFPVDNLDSLIDVLSNPDSTELKRYGYQPTQIPIENVYGFKLQNKQLINTTPELRDYLISKLPNLKSGQNQN